MYLAYDELRLKVAVDVKTHSRKPLSPEARGRLVQQLQTLVRETRASLELVTDLQHADWRIQYGSLNFQDVYLVILGALQIIVVWQ